MGDITISMKDAITMEDVMKEETTTIAGKILTNVTTLTGGITTVGGMNTTMGPGSGKTESIPTDSQHAE
jgi:hypothetical protein